MAVSREFPNNNVLKSMQLSGDFLHLRFYKKDNKIENRIYRCHKEVAYKLYHCQKAKACLEIFNDFIKEKMEVVQVTIS